MRAHTSLLSDFSTSAIRQSSSFQSLMASFAFELIGRPQEVCEGCGVGVSTRQTCRNNAAMINVHAISSSHAMRRLTSIAATEIVVCETRGVEEL